MSPQTFILFGASGSGKGTQANLLIDYLKKNDSQRKVLYEENGQRFRDFVESHNSFTSQLTKEVMQTGELLPEFLPIWMWSEFLIKNLAEDEHLILEGVSRREHEAPVLDSAMKFYKREKPHIISIEVSRNWSTERLTARGREDDSQEDIARRLEWYDQNVVKAIEYFKNDSYYNFISINGEQTIEKVHSDIMEKLGWQ